MGMQRTMGMQRIKRLLDRGNVAEAAAIAEELFDDYYCGEAMAVYDAIYDYVCEKNGAGSEEAIYYTCRIALCHYRSGDYDEALALLQTVTAWYEDRGKGSDTYCLDAALFICDIYQYYNRIDEAEELCRRGLATALEKYGESASITIAHMERLGEVCCEKGDFAEGMSFQQRVLYLREENGESENDIADAYDELGRGYEAAWDYGKALECFDEGLKRLDIKKEPQLTFTYLKLLNDKANVLSDMCREKDALAIAQEVLRVSEEYLPPDNPNICVAKSNVADRYGDMGNYARAAEIFEECVRWLLEHYGEKYHETIRVMGRLSVAYLCVGRHDEALEAAQRAYRATHEMYGDENDSTMRAYRMVGHCYLGMGRCENARDILRRVYEYWERERPEDGRQYDCLSEYLHACVNCGEYEFAIERAGEAVERIRSDEVLSKYYNMNNLINIKANALNRTGRHSEAIELQREAIEDLTQRYGGEHPYTLNDTTDLIDFLRDDGQLEEAYRLSCRVVEIRTREGISYPNPYGHRIQLARLCIDTGRYDRAGEILGEIESDADIVKDSEHYSSFCYANALLCRARGDRERALSYVKKGERASKAVSPEGSEEITRFSRLAEELRKGASEHEAV